MKNNYLSRRLDSLKSDFESLTNDLVSEIEQLEDSKSDLENEIDNLNAEIERLKELKSNEFFCNKCKTIHTKSVYAIAQLAMGNELIFTCDCGKKITLTPN